MAFEPTDKGQHAEQFRLALAEVRLCVEGLALRRDVNPTLAAITKNIMEDLEAMFAAAMLAPHYRERV